MLYVLILIFTLLFPSILAGYFFACIVLVLNFFNLNFSASGTLINSLQIGLTSILTVTNFVFVDHEKYRSSLKTARASLINFLIMVLVTSLWIYLLVYRYGLFRSKSLSVAVDFLKNELNIFSTILIWSTSLLFSFVIYYVIQAVISFFRR